MSITYRIVESWFYDLFHYNLQDSKIFAQLFQDVYFIITYRIVEDWFYDLFRYNLQDSKIFAQLFQDVYLSITYRMAEERSNLSE